MSEMPDSGPSSAIQSNMAATGGAASAPGSSNMSSTGQSLDPQISPPPELGGVLEGNVLGTKNFDEAGKEALHGGLMHSIAGSGVSSIGEMTKSEQGTGFAAPPGVGGITAAKPGIGFGAGW